MKKILMIGYMPPPYHGVVRMTEIIKNSKLINEKFDLNVFYLKAVKTAENRGRFGLKNIFFNALNLISFFIKCLQKRYDILYLSIAQNNLGFFRDSIFILIAKIFRFKVIAHYHAGDFIKSYNVKSNFLQFYIKYIFKKIDKLLVLANKIKEQFKGFIEDKKITVLYNFIEESFIPQENKKDFNSKTINILFIGYISKAKGAVDLVKAAKIVLENLHEFDIKFWLCGDFVNEENNVIYIDSPHGGYNETSEFIKANSLGKNIFLPGYIDDKKKKELLKKTDLFVLPSYSEGFPVSVLEAMSYGLPLVLTRVGALDEVLKEKENCFFSNLGNNKDLSNKIIELITNLEVRRNMSQANYSLIKNVYNLANYEKKLISLLESQLIT